MFPGARREGLESRAPLLITTDSTVAVPSGAKFIHAYIVAGGGSGGVGNAAGGDVSRGCGGGCGGAAYIIADVNLVRGNLAVRTSKVRTVSFTIGSGGLAVNTTTSAVSGNSGGSTVLTFDGTGITTTVTGGSGGIGETTGATSTSAAGTLSGSFAQSLIVPGRSAVWAWPLFGGVARGADAVSGDSSSCYGGNAADSNTRAGVGMSSSGALLPWWLQQVGFTLGSGGSGATSGATKQSGGGGGGFGGNGGNGAASNTVGATATAGTGYGSGGGGASGTSSNTTTSGAGAPGCAVIMFECEV